MKKIMFLFLLVLVLVNLSRAQNQAQVGYQLEFHNCPKDSNFLVIHLNRTVSAKYESSSFTDNKNSLAKFLTQKNTKRSINGLVSAQAEIYKVTIEKGNVFSWKTLIPQIKLGIQRWFKIGVPIVAIKKPIYKGCEYGSREYTTTYTATATYR